MDNAIIMAQVAKARTIARIRKARGLSQARLAARAGLHPSTLSLAESGKLLLGNGQVRRLAKALGVSITDLDWDGLDAASRPRP